MRSHTAPVPLKAGLLLLLSTWSHVASALDPDICSTFNTGGQEPADDTPKMSNGYCVDTCKSEYAYAITQGEKCWCSNYAPAEDVTVSLGQCNQGCPSYPLEPCGGSGVFSFMRLRNPVSGTKGAVSSPSPKPVSSLFLGFDLRLRTSRLLGRCLPPSLPYRHLLFFSGIQSLCFGTCPFSLLWRGSVPG